MPHWTPKVGTKIRAFLRKGGGNIEGYDGKYAPFEVTKKLGNHIDVKSLVAFYDEGRNKGKNMEFEFYFKEWHFKLYKD